MATYSDDLRKIRISKKVGVIEGIFDEIIFHLKYLVPSQWIIEARKWSDPYSVVDAYVFVTTILSVAILWWSNYAPLASALVATYFLAGTIVNVLNVVFLTKIFGRPVSTERTLLLFFLNVAQVLLTFAIWYRFMLGKQAGEAFFNAMLVFGTLGYPKEKGADVFVGLQIATDFFLLAVYLAFIVSNMERRH